MLGEDENERFGCLLVSPAGWLSRSLGVFLARQVSSLLASLDHPYLSRVYECGFGLDKTSFFVCRFFSKDG